MHRLKDATREFLPGRGLIGPVAARIELLPHGQLHGRRAEPGVARRHFLIGGRLRLDADQRAGGNVGPRRHHRVIAHEDARARAHPLQMHVATTNVLVAKDHLVGDEALLADVDEIVAARQIGGDFGVLADLGAHQPIPGPHVDGGEERRQGLQRHFRRQGHGPFAQIEPGMDGIGPLGDARQDDPAHHRDQADRNQHQRERGGPGHDRDGKEIDGVINLAHDVIDLVEDPEGREDRQQADGRDHQQQNRIDGCLRGAHERRGVGLRRQAVQIHHTDLAGGRAVPDLAGSETRARGDGGQIPDLGAAPDDHILLDDAGGAEIDVVANLNASDDEFVALDARVGEFHLGAKARARANGDEIGRAPFGFADQRVIAHAGAQRAQIEAHDGRALEPLHMEQVQKAMGQPPAEIIGAPEGIAPRLRAPEQDPLHGDADEHRRDVDADIDAQQRDHFLQQRGGSVGQQHVADEDAQPLRRHQGEHDGQGDRLREAAQETAQQRRRGEGQIAWRRHELRAALQQFAHGAQAADFIDILQGERGQFVMLAHQRQEARRQQGMAAQIGEEIRIEGNGLRRQHALGGLQQFRLSLGARLLLLLAHVGRGGEGLLLESVAVRLAGRQTRQFLQQLETRRRHIGGQLLAQSGAQGARIKRAAIAGDEGDELVHAIVVAQNDGGLRQALQLQQLGLDLAQLHAKAADLHLIVDAPTKQNVTTMIQRHGVAGAIEHAIFSLGIEGIGDELFRRKLIAAQIAQRHARPADEQLAFNPVIDEIEGVIDHITGVIGDRPTDGDGLARAHFRNSRHHRGLGGAVAVEDGAARPAPACRHRGRAGLATQNDDAQPRHIARQHGEQRRHGVEHGDARALHQVRQAVGVGHHGGVRHIERGAHEIGDPDLLHGQIEGDRGALEDHVRVVEPVDLIRRAQVVADVALGDDDALGDPSRARGVDHVGGMIWRRPQRAGADDGGVQLVDQVQLGQHVAIDAALDAGRLGGTGEQGAGGAILEADRDAIQRGVRVKGQPGGAGLGDGDLGD